MEQYINKAALVAEIKKRRDSFYSLSKSCEKGTPAKAGFYAQAQTLEGILSFLDTFEVKDVDLEEEVDKWYIDEAPKEFENILYSDIENFAKYFFELGLKTKDQ